MAVPQLDLSFQNGPLVGQMCRVLEQIVTSGQFVLGAHVDHFERQLAERCQVQHAVGVSSGTDALLLALMALGVEPGDEVITTPFSFFATVGCIARLGARPVFVDIDPMTFNIDPDLIEQAITDKTRAIIPVHLFGQAAAMESIMAIAHRHGVHVIEDAAQSIGALLNDRPVTSIGDVNCLSFYPTKNLSALGDAGACTTNDDSLADRLRCLRVHGQDAKYHHAYIGGNFRIDAIQAAMLSMKLPNLPAWNEQRRAVAGRYHTMLKELPLGLPDEISGHYHVYNQYTIRVLDGRRDALVRHLTGGGIGCDVYYPVPLHLQPCFSYLRKEVGPLPVAEKAAQQVLSLPMFPGLSANQQEEVVATIGQFFHRGAD